MRTKKIKKVIVQLLPWAALLIFILIHTGLFFEETKVTDELGKKIEELRPLFFGLSIGACVLGFLHGVFRYKIPFFGADPNRKAKKEGREIKEKTTLRKALNAVFAGLLVVGNAILSFFIVELINNPWIEQMADIHILLGCGICLAFFIVFIFLTNSVSIGAVFANVFLTFWACLNYFVLEFRSIPFQWIDIASYRTAMNVASNYHLTMTWQIVVGITGAAFASGILLHMEIFHIFKRWPGKLAARGIAALTALLFFFVIFKTNLLADTGIWLRDWHPQYTYKRFGMQAGFLAFAKASFPTAPDVYSAEHLSEIIEKSESEPAPEKLCTEEPEIILCIMNESFSDLSIYPNVETDREVMPFINSLTENAQHGQLCVSVIGGTTANSEYEFLTGNSCMLSPQTVVYNSYIKQDQFSLARNLKAQGYRAVAQHPYYPNGWNRQIVYPRMGFDEFVSYADYKNPEKLRGFITDDSDYEKLKETIEAKKDGEKLFIFNVTMQNHGEYDFKNFTNTVHLKNFEGESKEYMEQYLTLMNISDKALEKLIDYLKTRKEKILLCFFGDHQPALPDDFVEYAFGKKAEELSFAEEQMEYRTRYLIWANYDIPESNGKLLSTNYLASYMLRLTNLKESGYNQYLNRLQGTYQGINAFGYVDEDGDTIKHDKEPELEDYKCLIYNELTGGDSRDTKFFAV
ncbi:MAG: LTA synthase family protein, partial [bacterium]